MPDALLYLAAVDSRSTWVRPRTLVLLRFVAAAAQSASVAIGAGVFGLQLPIFACALAIALLLVGNLAVVATQSDSRSLSEREAVFTLIADLCQLALVLGLTGGLSNPFALLLIGPVTIAASALGLSSTIILGAVTVALATVISLFNLPLRTDAGEILRAPWLFELGFWLSIVLGVVFLSAYARRVAVELRSMSRALAAAQMALAREQKLTDLGAVVAAAAHELGTPLATIKLVSRELARAVEGRPELAELQDDIRLIAEQTDRCRDILHSMGRVGKDDPQLRTAPLGEVLREAAEPHLRRGKALGFDIRPGPGGAARHPVIARSPEVIHGLRNLIQNAVDFAQSEVSVEGQWTDATLEVTIRDDGRGFPPQVLSRIGEPFLRAGGATAQPEGPDEGMGLGLFIAKTLLERTGAQLSFENGEASGRFRGATVQVLWPLSRLGGA
jgi:two-component system sensor histidine kinase RegB